MFRLANLSKRYIAGDIQTTALNQVDLTIAPGEYVAVVGPSGCGKSSLLSLMGLLDTPDEGELWFEGQNVSHWSEDQLNNLRQGRIGFIFQSFNLIEELSVFENVELPLEYSSISAAERHERVNRMLDRLGIAHRAQHRPSQLSGGQQQRVAIARALVAAPGVLLADEPTGNLDSAHGDEVMQLLREINAEGTTVIMVTHSPEHAAQAKRTIRLLDGKVVSEAGGK
jgi:putative ABC transport system ATP-binding protein